MTDFQCQQQQGQLLEGGNAQPAQIQVNVVVNLQQSNLNLQINIDPNIPFSAFIGSIKQQIFEQQVQYEEQDVTLVKINRNILFKEFTNEFRRVVIRQNLATNEVEYELKNVGKIKISEMRSLTELGFTFGCELIVKSIGQPQCSEHNKPITKVCIEQHPCQNRLLCSECTLKHRNISLIKMTSLKKFEEQVQYNIRPFDIFDCSELLTEVKTLEINANLLVSQFSYQIKRLIKSIENMNKEVSKVKKNLENLWPEKLSQKELEEMIKYYDGDTLDDKEQYEQFTFEVLEQNDRITQCLSRLSKFKKTLDLYLPDQNQNIVVNVVVRIDEQEEDKRLQTSIDPDIPFNVFIDTISSKLFKQNKQQEQIAYFKLDGNINIYQNEVRTLAELGFINESALLVTK